MISLLNFKSYQGKTKKSKKGKACVNPLTWMLDIGAATEEGVGYLCCCNGCRLDGGPYAQAGSGYPGRGGPPY